MAVLSISGSSPAICGVVAAAAGNDDCASPTTALLSPAAAPPPPSGRSMVLLYLAVSTLVCAAAAAAFAYLALSSPHSPARSVARPLTKLRHPTVILISSDGFRFGYQFKAQNPTISRLIANGTSAAEGLIPVFPTLTFPNHYSIVTGLYPPYHGIINNGFVDPVTGARFTMSSHEPFWWLGEPLWETVANHGLRAATYFWPGSEVVKGRWTCPPGYCAPYNSSVPFEERVDTVLGYFDLPEGERPSFITLYFEDPDHQGHQVGPDDPAITAAVEHIDTLLGRLVKGLEWRGVFDDVTVILVGDHGMITTCDKKLLFLEDLKPWIDIPDEWVQSVTPLLAIRPPEGVASPVDVVRKINEALASGKVANGEYLKVYLKEELPARLHYADSYRIPPVIGLLAEGYKLELHRSSGKECGGAHGYDNAFSSMRSVFIAHGPQFAAGRRVTSFENIQIYNVVTAILGLKGAPNNGSADFANEVLLPKY